MKTTRLDSPPRSWRSPKNVAATRPSSREGDHQHKSMVTWFKLNNGQPQRLPVATPSDGKRVRKTHRYVQKRPCNQDVPLIVTSPSTANQNESAVRHLKLGTILPTIISLVLRLLFRRHSFPPSKTSLLLYVGTFFPAFFLSNHLIKMGTTRRDPTTGTLISYGEDLQQPGMTEWCFDILYITCEPARTVHVL